MFGGFNGDFRRKPIVSIRGASKKETREELLARARKEREQREALRVETRSSIRLQSAARRFLATRRIQKQLRDQFDEIQRNVGPGKKHPKNVQILDELLKRLFLCFNPHQDKARLLLCCSLVIELKNELHQEMLKTPSPWRYKITRLLHACVLVFESSSREENINSCLRVFEIFTKLKKDQTGNYSLIGDSIYHFSFLLSRRYFESIRCLCDTRVPPILEETTHPPTPMSDMVLDMLKLPLSLMSHADQNYKRLLTESLSSSFLSKEFSEQVRLFILPALAASDFPTLQWIRGTNIDDLEPTKWMLYSFLKLVKISNVHLSSMEYNLYLQMLAKLSLVLTFTRVTSTGVLGNDEDEDEEDLDIEQDENLRQWSNDFILCESVRMLNDSSLINSLLSGVEQLEDDVDTLKSLCHLCHNLLLSSPKSIHIFKILSTLAFRPKILRRLWNVIINTNQEVSIGTPMPLLKVLGKGLRMSRSEQEKIVPPMAVFTALFGYTLVTVHDTEFFGDSAQSGPATRVSSNSRIMMPFDLQELLPMSLILKDVALGLVELAYPESRPSVGQGYQFVVKSVRKVEDLDTRLWSNLFKNTVDLLRQLYNRDMRRQYCSPDHWICSNINLPVDKPRTVSFGRSRLRHYRPFQGLRAFTREELDAEGPPLTTKEVRQATILREMPYAIPFSQRLLLFHNLISRDKSEHQGEMAEFGRGPAISVMIRRSYLYEDAFEKLSVENEPNMRLKMRVQMKNVTGLDEAGIDGGGLFRDFLTELLRTAFNPNRGFFKLTRDNQLYPNPLVHHIHEDYAAHFFFIGRMLGKALYENLLVELPLASFFLTKLLGSNAASADIDNLSSLDPELYRNLLYLKNYDGNVQDLNLDFSMVTEEVGHRAVEELKPGGSEIPVTNENRIEYIHLVADYKLNKQIRMQCTAFRNGLSDVIDLDWLRMFSCRELQTLISGSEQEIDIDDLEANTNYGNGFSKEHPTVMMFWKVVRSMNEDGKRNLLRFVTSCSRPPLLGFKELNPPFGIQKAGDESSRLPTASTCMNLLKLPEFKDEKTLEEKLRYAIESGAGFELS